MSNAFITPAELASALSAGDVAVLDVRFRSGQEPRPLHPARIDGARAVDVNTFIGEKTPTSGNGPLPALDALRTQLATWGIGPDTVVVVYGDEDQTGAARAWAVLRWAGVADVRVLDGGIEAWTAEGLPAGDSVAENTPGDPAAFSSSALTSIDADEAARIANDSVLIDSRPRGAFDGSADQPGTGHIPGAINVPAGRYFTDGKVKSVDELSNLVAEFGIHPGTEVGVYCGGGFAAAKSALALAAAGVDAKVYFGSWSEWITDPSRPIEVTAPARAGDGAPSVLQLSRSNTEQKDTAE